MHSKTIKKFRSKSICECRERNFNRKKIRVAFVGDVMLIDKWFNGCDFNSRSCDKRQVWKFCHENTMKVHNIRTAPKKPFWCELFPSHFALLKRKVRAGTERFSSCDKFKEFKGFILTFTNKNRQSKSRKFPHFSLSWLNNHFFLMKFTNRVFGTEMCRLIAQKKN